MTFNARISHNAYYTLFNPLALIMAEIIPCLCVCMEVKCRNNRRINKPFTKTLQVSFFLSFFLRLGLLLVGIKLNTKH